MWVFIFWAAAFLYLGLQTISDLKGGAFFKALPILILAGVAWQQLSEAPAYLFIIAALLLSAGGDVALETDGERYFVVGLGLFLLAHIAYIAAFATSVAWSTVAILPIAFVLIFGITLTRKLYPKLGRLRIPVCFYILAIMLMGFTAALHYPTNGWLIVGAIIFMLSDASIAVSKFLRPIPYRDQIVMGSYYLAQFMLVYGFVSNVG